MLRLLGTKTIRRAERWRSPPRLKEFRTLTGSKRLAQRILEPDLHDWDDLLRGA